MKKKVVLIVSLIIVLCLITIFTIYFSNYKNINQIKELLKKGTNLPNVYAEHYIDNGKYENNIKQYKVDIYWKDNTLIYNVLGRIDYANFNTNESYSIENQNKTYPPISSWTKFNDYSNYFDQENNKYYYVFPCYVGNTWCDKVIVKNDYGKNIFYIGKKDGLVMKKVSVGEDGVKRVETFSYKFNTITDEQLNQMKEI